MSTAGQPPQVPAASVPTPTAPTPGALLLQRPWAALWRALVAGLAGGVLAAGYALLDLDLWNSLWELGLFLVPVIAAVVIFHLLVPSLSVGQRLSGSMAGLLAAAVVGPVGGLVTALVGSLLVDSLTSGGMWEQALDRAVPASQVIGVVLAACAFGLVFRLTVRPSRR